MHPFQELFQSEAASKENIICFFRFQTLSDSQTAYEALRNKRGVFCDLSDMEATEILRFKDYMQGVCISMNATAKEICEDYVAYFPSIYHLQQYEN